MKRKLLIVLTCLPFFGLAQTRDNAGLQGDAGAVSGFFETFNPVNYPSGATSWWHLLDVRHSNPANNFAMQFSGSFYDQQLFFRKTNNNASQAWSRILTETDKKVGIGTATPVALLEISQTHDLVNNKSLKLFYGGSWGSSAYASDYRFVDISSTEEGQILQVNAYGMGLGYNPPVYSSSDRLYINGNVGIGTNSPKEKLSVNGNVRAREVKVETSNWPDYVFEDDFKLETLQELENYLKLNKHLPEIPSAKEVEQNGIALGEMNKKLLQKIEELTLHLIEKDKEVKNVKARLKAIEELIAVKK